MTVDLPMGATRAQSLARVCEVNDGCITCGDVAVILTVLSTTLSTTSQDALCRDDEGRTENVAVELVQAVVPGDRLLVHAGVALERVTKESP